MIGIEMWGLILTMLGGLGSMLVWIVNRVIKIGEMNANIDYLIRKVDKQVSNSHETNLREDLTELIASVESLKIEVEILKDWILERKHHD